MRISTASASAKLPVDAFRTKYASRVADAWAREAWRTSRIGGLTVTNISRYLEALTKQEEEQQEIERQQEMGLED